MSKEERISLEKDMGNVFDALIADKNYGGNYYSLTPGHKNELTDEKYKELVKKHVMFKDMSADTYLSEAGIASDWPYGRGCY